MKKFLIGFGSFLILLGAGGIINHISMVSKSVQEEQEMYGGSAQFMMVQLISTMGPYITCLIGGGIIIALALFLIEYQRRSELTSQLIKVLSEQQSMFNETKTKESYTKQKDNKKADATTIISKPEFETQPETPTNQDDDERFYWKG